jgi:hypothetical protein
MLSMLIDGSPPIVLFRSVSLGSLCANLCGVDD